jgi:uncharacterized protein (TIGR00255 family)
LLLSMTGFGEAHRRTDDVAVAVEVRTINGRYFKLNFKSPDGYSALESDVESIVREQVKRGTVQVNLRIDRARSAEDYRLNLNVLANYRQQIENLHQQWQSADAVSLETLLMLPGVVDEDPIGAFDPAEDLPLMRETLLAALENLSKMRMQEGLAMQADLTANCAAIAAELASIAVRAPLVVAAYRARLEERIGKALEQHEITLNPSDLIREISVYAERSDISEEIVRLQSHLEQFDAIMKLPESSGRKLDFLTQELFREANTIGSKSSDVQISRHVIEIKASIEKIREMIQNIE